MGLFDFFKGPDFNEGIETYKNTKDAVLLDVRTQEEYLEGRVPGSWNIPLQEIQKVERLIDKAAFCILFKRSKKPYGSGAASADGICKGYKSWRY